MKISTAGIKLIACGALVAVGLTVGSGAAHAAPVLIEPTADQCKMFVQIAVDEGETFAFELSEHGLDATGCPAPVPPADCHEVKDSDGDYDCNSDDDAPAPVPTADCHDSKDYDGDYDCTPTPPKPAVVTNTGDSSSAPVVEAVKGVTISNAAPAVAAAATPAKAATLSTPVLAAAATPTATTAKALPLTGGDITGIVLLAFAGLGIGGALLLVDKRRRTA
jgi:LPXTG-motif cell wall-anchored protein